MAKYLLRLVRQVVVLELTGEERVIEAETEQRLHLEARKFLVEKFPGAAPDVEVEIKKVGEEQAVTESLPEDFKPVNRAKIRQPQEPF